MASMTERAWCRMAVPGLLALTVLAPAQAGERHAASILAAARATGLDARLLQAMVTVESGHDALAVSPKGAIGLMQVMPATGRRFGFTDLADPDVNLRAGATYLKWLLAHFDGDLTLAVAAYNAGEGAVHRHGRQVPPYPETRQYVRRVLSRYRGGQPVPPPSRLGQLAGLLLSSPVPAADETQNPTESGQFRKSAARTPLVWIP